ncbi:MAG TPA: N,N-dimethylformamidase beta subunit family domain-containing protein [Actinomycetota bacterium]|nr:N,N-dimethylformamidase beta subunit family domain-containing protein [Actinomycetota bacterium]
MTLEAYCWPLSVAAGEPVALHVSTDAGHVEVEVAREGADRAVMWHASGVLGRLIETPPDASAYGCRWPVASEIPVGADWRSGYHAVTVRAGAERADAFFAIRPRPADASPILLVLATTTYHAYNDWGGPSLYTGGTRVSFERPVARGFLDKPEPAGRMMQTEPDREAMGYRNWARPLGLSDWSGASGWWNWERPFTRWAEALGYRMDVAVSWDLEHHPEVLDGKKLFVCVGHDEYWSWGMRDALDAFVRGGGHAAIFSGNTCCWQVRFEDDHRAMTSYKYRADDDPVLGTDRQHLLSGAWADRRVGRPETESIGLTFTRAGYSRYGLGAPDSAAAYEVHRPEHWVFEGTGLQRGGRFGERDAIVAYECDGCALRTDPHGFPVPTHADGAPEGLEILATAPAHLWAQHEQPSRYADDPGDLEFAAKAVFGSTDPGHLAELADGRCAFGVFTRPGGGTVVNVGVIDWALGLGDPVVGRITHNILERLSGVAENG